MLTKNFHFIRPVVNIYVIECYRQTDAWLLSFLFENLKGEGVVMVENRKTSV